MALTKVINDLADLNQSGTTNALKGCAGTTAEQPASSSSIDYLIVGGGGAGGETGGGGGAGGYLTGSTTVYHGTPTVITVGEGGSGISGISNVVTSGIGSVSNGNDSGFNGIRAIGGGTGGSWANSTTQPGWMDDGKDGGSGGGGASTGLATTGGNGTTDQGMGGGIGWYTTSGWGGGGGGGAGNPAGDANGTGIDGTASQGGNGGSGIDVTSFISVANANLAQIGDTSNTTQVFVAGGGGAGIQYVANTPGTGGSGGGGNGTNNNTTASSGTINTGGGGGGGGYDSGYGDGGDGGSGVAVLKYDNTIVTGYTLNSEDTYTVNWPADKYGVAYWPLNLDVKDVGGHYDGTATDITYTNGKFNQAASFNGSSAKIETGYVLPANSTMSFSFWAKFDAVDNGSQRDFFGNTAINGSGANADNRLGFRLTNAGYFYINIGNGTTFSSNSTLADATPYFGQWTFLCITLNGTAVNLYINNNSPVSWTAGIAFGTVGVLPLMIGEWGQGFGTKLYKGDMEQFRVYASELSSTDVQDIYNNSKPGSLPSLKTSSELTTTTCNYPSGVTGGGLYEFTGTANDTCGANNGTFTNSSYSSTIAKFGQSAGPFVYNSSPGSETRIYTGNGNEVTTTEGNKTLSAWVYPTGANTQGGFIVFANGKLLISYSSSTFYAYKYINGTDIFDTSCSGGQTKSITSSAIYAINTWHHVAVVMSGTGDYDFKLYINGIDTNGTQGSTAFCGYNTTNGGFIIGGSYNYLGTHYYNGFDGYIDQVRVYASALTDQNVYDLWQKENDIQTYFPNSSTDTDTLVFKEGSGEITFKNDSPPGAEVGMLRYNSTLGQMEHFNSGGWKDFTNCTTSICNYPITARCLYTFNGNYNDLCGNTTPDLIQNVYFTPGKFDKLGWNVLGLSSYLGYSKIGWSSGLIADYNATDFSISLWLKLNAYGGASALQYPYIWSGWSNAYWSLHMANTSAANTISFGSWSLADGSNEVHSGVVALDTW